MRVPAHGHVYLFKMPIDGLATMPIVGNKGSVTDKLPINLESLGVDAELWRGLPFSERLKQLLKHTKVSQAQLSRDAGIARATLGRILAGDRECQPREIDWIAGALGVDRSVLTDGLDLGSTQESEQLARVLQELMEARQRASDAELARATAEESLAIALKEAEQDRLRLEEQARQKDAKHQTELASERASFEERISQLTTDLAMKNWGLITANLKKTALEKEKASLQHQVAHLTEQVAQAHRAIAQAQGAKWMTGLLGALVGLGGASLALSGGSRDDEDDFED